MRIFNCCADCKWLWIKSSDVILLHLHKPPINNNNVWPCAGCLQLLSDMQHMHYMHRLWLDSVMLWSVSDKTTNIPGSEIALEKSHSVNLRSLCQCVSMRGRGQQRRWDDSLRCRDTPAQCLRHRCDQGTFMGALHRFKWLQSGAL